MNEALKEWLYLEREKLEKKGLRISVKDHGYMADALCVDIDGDQFVSCLWFWPEDTFEYQCHDNKTGDVVILETKNFNKPEQLQEYLNDLFYKRLIKLGLLQ